MYMYERVRLYKGLDLFSYVECVYVFNAGTTLPTQVYVEMVR